MYWNGPFEDDAPARYYVSPPDESWDEEAKHEWLAGFSVTMGPAVTVHEVAPGHFAHGRIIRQLARGDVRRSLFSEAFVEGWAHYAGELMVEQGFRADDPDLPSASTWTPSSRCPTYGRYTWGKLDIMSLRDEALAAWGTNFSLRRFHEALLTLGAPPLGTMGDALVT